MTANRQLPTFGEALRHRREQMGLSQKELAQKAGISQATLAQWELRAGPPRTVPQLEKLATALEVAPDQIAAGSIPDRYEHTDASRDQLVQRLVRMAHPRASIASTVRLLNLVLDLSLAEQKALANFLESRSKGQP